MALAVSQGAKEVKSFKDYELTVNNIFNYYDYSPVRYNRLRELQDVMLSEQVALKEPHSVRWLSLHEAVNAVKKCFPALVAALGEDAANGNAVARGLSKNTETYTFVAHTCLLSDILPLFTKLSKCFQLHNLDYDKVQTMLGVTRESLRGMLEEELLLPSYHELRELPVTDDQVTWNDIPLKKTEDMDNRCERAKSQFLNELLANLDRRFPDESMSQIGKLNTLLNPRKLKAIPVGDVAQYGLKELEEVSEVMFLPGAPNVGFNSDRARSDFQSFKIFARNSKNQNLQDFACELITLFNDEFPDFAILMEYFLVVPLNSATCERGFSSQNIVKTKHRNRLTEQRMDQLLRVAINGPMFDKFDYDKAAKHFRDMKERRK